MMKNEWKWMLGFLAASVVLVGLITAFEFREFEIQWHDTYWVTGPGDAIFYLAGGLWISRNLYLLIRLLTDKNPVFALVFSIVNALACLLLAIVLSLYLQTVPLTGDLKGGTFLAALVVTGLLTLLIVLEVRTVSIILRWVGGQPAS